MKTFTRTSCALVMATVIAAASAWAQSPEAIHPAYADLPGPPLGAGTLPTPVEVPLFQSSLLEEEAAPRAAGPLPEGVSPVASNSPVASSVVGASYIDCGQACLMERCDPGYSYWFAGVELTSLTPHYSTLLFDASENRGAFGPRAFVGWESDHGLGFRGRFWVLDQDLRLTVDGEPVEDSSGEFTAGRFDFDVYRRFSWDRSGITVGGSVTAAELDVKLDVPIVDERLDAEESGAGVGFFVEGRHEFATSPFNSWAILMRGRWAALVGEWELPQSTGRTEGDGALDILEAGLGYEWRHKLRRCGFGVQHFIEAQAWNAELFGGVNFLGQSLSLGFHW